MIVLDNELEAKLRGALGPDFEEFARDALIAEAYRTTRMSIGEVARVLGTSIDQAYGFMKERGIPLAYAVEDLERDLAILREMRP